MLWCVDLVSWVTCVDVQYAKPAILSHIVQWRAFLIIWTPNWRFNDGFGLSFSPSDDSKGTEISDASNTGKQGTRNAKGPLLAWHLVCIHRFSSLSWRNMSRISQFSESRVNTHRILCGPLPFNCRIYQRHTTMMILQVWRKILVHQNFWEGSSSSPFLQSISRKMTTLFIHFQNCVIGTEQFIGKCMEYSEGFTRKPRIWSVGDWTIAWITDLTSRFEYCVDTLCRPQWLRVIPANSGGVQRDSKLQRHIEIPNGWTQFLCQIGSSFYYTSIVEGGLLAGGISSPLEDARGFFFTAQCWLQIAPENEPRIVPWSGEVHGVQYARSILRNAQDKLLCQSKSNAISLKHTMFVERTAVLQSGSADGIEIVARDSQRRRWRPVLPFCRAYGGCWSAHQCEETRALAKYQTTLPACLERVPPRFRAVRSPWTAYVAGDICWAAHHTPRKDQPDADRRQPHAGHGQHAVIFLEEVESINRQKHAVAIRHVIDQAEPCEMAARGKVWRRHRKRHQWTATVRLGRRLEGQCCSCCPRCPGVVLGKGARLHAMLLAPCATHFLRRSWKHSRPFGRSGFESQWTMADGCTTRSDMSSWRRCLTQPRKKPQPFWLPPRRRRN